MKLYDTSRREVVEIIPSVPGVLKIYACGPTVYRDAHVGNMRTFLLTDLIKRFAQYQKAGVMNTDSDAQKISFDADF